MFIESVMFWAFGLLAVAAAIGVVLHRSIIYSALMLILVFMSIAGVFVLNNADFLAIAQIIVYGVGLTIILLFGIMFTGDRPLPRFEGRGQRVTALLLVVLFSAGLLIASVQYPFLLMQAPQALVERLQSQGSTGLLGEVLFTTYALPFEVASVLLLGAMIGAIVIAKKKFVPAGEDLGGTTFTIEPESRLPSGAAEAARRALDLGRAPVGGAAAGSDKGPEPPTSEGQPDQPDQSSEMAGVH